MYTESRTGATYQELKHRLLLGEFPLTDRLAEARLASLLGVSRTPVREALARLHAEDLVERHPEGGYRPAPPDLRRVHELYEVRFALELHAIGLPARNGSSHDRTVLGNLRDEWDDLAAGADLPASPEFVLLDEDFHVRLATSAGNEAIVDTLMATNERIPMSPRDHGSPTGRASTRSSTCSAGCTTSSASTPRSPPWRRRSPRSSSTATASARTSRTSPSGAFVRWGWPLAT